MSESSLFFFVIDWNGDFIWGKVHQYTVSPKQRIWLSSCPPAPLFKTDKNQAFSGCLIKVSQMPQTDSLKWCFQMLLRVPPQCDRPQQHSVEDEDAWVEWVDTVGNLDLMFCICSTHWILPWHRFYLILPSCCGFSLAVFWSHRCMQTWVQACVKAFQTARMSFTIKLMIKQEIATMQTTNLWAKCQGQK